MVYPIGYVGVTHRWYAETVDGAVVWVGDIAPHPASADLALSLAWSLLGADNVSKVIPEWELEPVAA